MTSRYAGYMGKVMAVDLSTETVTEYPWSDAQRERYLGGKIMAARILCDHLTGKEAPFSDKNWIVISTGPLTGSQLPRLGTAGLVRAMQAQGLLSTRNYSAGQFNDYELISGEYLSEKYNITNKGCLTCPIRCARTVSVQGKAVKGPELEALGLLSSNICNNDLKKVLEWNYLLDELGMDTISAANTIAYAMEASERGLWDNGLKFGSTDDLAALFEDIAYRRGIGNELAEGSRRLSETYGGREFAMHSKGLELAAYEPRQAVGQGLGYAVSNRGGCHLNGGYLVIMEGLGLNMDSQTPKAKADLTMLFQDLMETISASGQCLFTSYAFFPAFLLTNPKGIIAKTVNAAPPTSAVLSGLSISIPACSHCTCRYSITRK
ncbi:MAG: hypothetical protein IKJ99_09425 [Oscillospiraceae bacterium]|nr:hypothetical protein [Oscillospiraceae bacterium]MBR3974152.1 hypothetical protein [Oscillospiraceae bacterium]